MATPEQRAREQQDTGAVMAGAAAGTTAVVAGSAAFPSTPVLVSTATAKLSAEAVAGTLKAAFAAFQSNRRDDIFDMLVGFLRERYPLRPQEEYDEVLDEERRREKEFQRRSQARLVSGIREALKYQDPATQLRRIEAVLNQERNYTLAREEAAITRAVNRQEQRLLEELSPQGAFWALSPFVQNHTPDCVAMAGKFWPWSLLRKIAPPLHFGCACQLFGLQEAKDRGLLPRNFVPPLHDAGVIRLAHMLLKDHPEQRALLEAEFREQLHPRDRLGRWMDKPSQVPDDQRAYIAEGAMARGGLLGREWDIPVGRMEDGGALGTYGPKAVEASQFASEAAGFPVRVVATTYWPDERDGDIVHASASRALSTIYVKPETNDLTILHEVAHLMADEPGHGDAWVRIAYDLYGRYLGEEAAKVFGDLLLPERLYPEEGIFSRRHEHKDTPGTFRDRLEDLGHGRITATFNPSKHPRDRRGRFIETLNSLEAPKKGHAGDTLDVLGTPHIVHVQKRGYVVENTETGERREVETAEQVVDRVESERRHREAREELERSRTERAKFQMEKESRQRAIHRQRELEMERKQQSFLERYPVDENGRPYFYRVESPSQDEKVARLQQESGEIWGRAPRNIFAGDKAKVQAYRGRLPEGKRGVEFVTEEPPDPGASPGEVSWSSRAGRRLLRVEGEFAKLAVVITANTMIG